jgi:hypothetical protein
VKKSRFNVLAVVCIGLLGGIQIPLPAEANELRFYCDMSGSVPITKIHTTTRGDEKFIQWVQERGGYSVEERCREVSERFNRAISRGSLVLKKDKNFNGSPVICYVYQQGDKCDSNNILVTLSSIKQLNKAFEVFRDFQRGSENLPPKNRTPIKLSGDSETPSTVIRASGATGLPPIKATGEGVSPDDGDYVYIGRVDK